MLQVSIGITVEDSRNFEGELQGCSLPFIGKAFLQIHVFVQTETSLFLFTSVDVDIVNVINMYIKKTWKLETSSVTVEIISSAGLPRLFKT